MGARPRHFVGRQAQLSLLERDLDDVRRTGRGRFVLLRGRRRVGKSRLVSEFLRHTAIPAVFYAATPGPPDRELGRFADAIGRSTLAAAPLVRSGTTFAGWQAALSMIAVAAGDDACVVVVDELPYLLDGHPEIEAEFQHAWDQVLENRPVLLIAVGSDLSTMSALAGYGRPLYGRPTREIVLNPLTVAEVGDLLGVRAVDAIDAALVVGGFPLVALSWSEGLDRRQFLREALSDPTSALIVTGERALAAEFPDSAVRAALTAIGGGETAFTAVANRAGLPATTLRRTVDLLLSKKIVVAERPLSGRASPKLTRLRITDPYLRFWLRFVGPGLDEIERGRGDLVVDRVEESWSSYRGVAVEPLVRASLDRLLPDLRFGASQQVGAFWNRSHDIEVDLVGMADGRSATRVEMLGSVKWRENAAFGRSDLVTLQRSRELVPGADAETALVAVSRSGVEVTGLDTVLGPDDLVDAWR